MRSVHPARPPDGTATAYQRYVLCVLTAVYTLNFLDRGLMGILLQPIKVDLHLTDAQLGLLTGIAFGAFYATLGIPLARLADRGDRVTLTALAIGAWGVTAALCGAATSFARLLIARILAAVGEAGCMPPTYSLLGDYFPAPAQRARAMAVYWLANPLAALISFAAGGALNERYGWRAAFLLLGLPGLAVAILVKATVRETRIRRERGAQPQLDFAGIRAVGRMLWARRTLRHLTAGIILLFTLGLGLAPWYAAFMIRDHGMGTRELGLWLGLVGGASAAAGNLAGGYAAARWYRDDERGQVRLGAASVAALCPCLALFLLLPGRGEALLALVPLMLGFSMFLGPLFALLQRLVPEDQRATSLALVMLLANLIGMGIGPEAVGILSDALAPGVGAGSLRYAMLAMASVAVWAAYHFWQAGDSIGEELAESAA